MFNRMRARQTRLFVAHGTARLARVRAARVRPKLNCPLFGGILDPDMFSDPQMSMEVFLNIYDVIKILISDWTTDNSHFISV